MVNVEKGPKDIAEDIRLEQGSNAVVLITTTSQKEVFLNIEEALKNKKQVTKEKVKGNLFMDGGCLLMGGIIATISRLAAAREINDILLAVGGCVAVGLTGKMIYEGNKALAKASLASRQLKKIESTIK
jgi:hypothetical protein